MYYFQIEGGTVFETASLQNWKGAKRLTAKAGKAAMREQAKAHLRQALQPGDTVYCILRSVSRSGMSRQIDFYAKDHQCLTGWIAEALDYPRHERNGALKVGGCGMDMGFSVVSNLGAVLWPNGTPEPHGRRNGESDSDGGYALKHSWL